MCKVKAVVKNKQLVVHTRNALEKGIWMKEASSLQNCAFRIDKDRNGSFALRCVINKARTEDIDTIANFKTAEDADKALNEISRALFSARELVTNDNGQIIKARMPLWATISSVIVLPLTVLLLYIFVQTGYAHILQTFMSLYWGGSDEVQTMPAATTAPVAPAAVEKIDPNATGVPLSADAFLQNLPQE